jgi:hypothetical protein
VERIDLTPGPIRGSELFPDVSDEIDRRIEHSEQRIKTWVLAGVAANLLVAIIAALPMIFYMGQISRDINQATIQQQALTQRLDKGEQWRNERMIWETRIEGRLYEKGILINHQPEETP